MNATIYKTENNILKNYIDYFLFLKNEGGTGFYKTFANTNVCLALYRQNAVDWNGESNICNITESYTYCSRLFGFHKKPFSVTYRGNIEQICILFKPEGISAFTQIPVNTIDRNDNPFGQMFGKDSAEAIEQIFSITGAKKQVAVLEKFLLKKFLDFKKESMLYALEQIRGYNHDEKNIVTWLAVKLRVHPSTLYRNFLSTFGQSPYEIYKTIRFRRTLAALLAGNDLFTNVAFDNHFFDQSHLIKDVKQFTGESPNTLLKKITRVQDTLLWLRK